MADGCFVLSSDDSSSDSHQPHKTDRKNNKRASSDDSSSDLSHKTNGKRVAHFLSDSESSDYDSRSNSPDVDKVGRPVENVESYEIFTPFSQNIENKAPAKGSISPPLSRDECVLLEGSEKLDEECARGSEHIKKIHVKGTKSLPLNKNDRALVKEMNRTEKIEKKLTREKLRRMKPGECIKSMKVIVDAHIENYPRIFSSIKDAIQEYGAEFALSSELPVRNCIIWTRCDNELENFWKMNNLMIMNWNIENSENDVIIIWSSQKFSNVVSDNKLSSNIQTIKAKLPNKRVTFLIYSGSDIDVESEDATVLYNGKTLRKKTTTLNKKRMEMELVRLQFEYDCSYRIIDAGMEVGKFIAQFTKAVSEIPFKKEKERQEQELAWLAAGDSRGCVRVNKSSHGLKQLWTQQLLQFNNCNLHAVNEITKRYPTPQALVQAFNRCDSDQEAATLLRDIPIVRKCIGDLAARRKLGPEISRKLYLLFTCKDPNVQLSNE